MSQVADTPPSAHKMPQLDALRAFAVLSVLFVHFVSRPPYWLAIVPWAACGVQLFFVLSGFLITGILLDSRKQVEAGVSRFWMLRQFYTRRFLRIFPLYYAVVLVAWIIKLPGFTDTLGWNLSYLTNFYIVQQTKKKKKKNKKKKKKKKKKKQKKNNKQKKNKTPNPTPTNTTHQQPHKQHHH